MKHAIGILSLTFWGMGAQAQDGLSIAPSKLYQPSSIADNPRLGYFAELTKWNLLRKNPIYWCLNCTEEFPFAAAFGSYSQDSRQFQRPIYLIDGVPINLNEPYATLQNFECIGSQIELGATPHYSFLSRQDLDVMPYSTIKEIVRSRTNDRTSIHNIPLYTQTREDYSMLYVVDGVVIGR